MKKWCWILIAVCLNGGGPPDAIAQVFGASARTEFFGGLGVRVFYSGIRKTELFLDDNKIRNTGDSQLIIHVVPITLVYGASPRFSVISVIPTLSRTFRRPGNQQIITDTNSGIGDVTLYGKYRFYKKDAFLKSRQIAFQAGLKFPTGKDNKEDGQGGRFPAPLQLGSGSLDYRFLLSFSEVRNRLTFTGDLGYTLRTEANNLEFGDEINYDFAAKFRIHPAKYTDQFPARDLYAVLEVNGKFVGKSELNGARSQDSGERQIFLAPGIQFLPVANILWEAGVQIPVLENLNGTQLGTDFQLRIGIRWFILP